MLDANLAATLKTHLAKITRPIELVTSLDDSPKSAELAELLDERVAPLDGVRAVRQRGLMTGVELAPPTDGLRWGRRVCAAAVARGVLLRPLGDVVVLMPMLTSTAPEIELIVDTLATAITEVAGAR